MNLKSSLLLLFLSVAQLEASSTGQLLLMGRVPASVGVKIETVGSELNDRESSFLVNFQKSGNLSADSDVLLYDSQGVLIHEAGVDTKIKKMTKLSKNYGKSAGSEHYLIRIVAH